jgi:hypothetical protein
MTHLRKMMLEELDRRNYAQTTIDCYIQTIEDFAHHFRRPPDGRPSANGPSDSMKRPIMTRTHLWLWPRVPNSALTKFFPH